MAVGDYGADFSPRGRRQAAPRRNELSGDPYQFGTPFVPPAAASSDTVFSDPYTAQLERLAQGQIDSLSQPWNDPGFEDVVRLIQSQVGRLQAGSPNALLGDFISQGRQRIAELNQEPFSAPEEDRLRTRAVQGVEAERSAARERALQDVSRRGMADSSGVLQELYSRADRSAEQGRTRAETDLAMYITGERQRRKSEATGISQALASAGAQEASRNDARQGQILAAAGMLADLNAQRRGEMKANRQEVLAIAASLAQLPIQRLQAMLGVLHGTGGTDIGNPFAGAMSMYNAAGNQNAYNQQGNSALMAGLGQLLGYYLGNRGGSGGPTIPNIPIFAGIPGGSLPGEVYSV